MSIKDTGADSSGVCGPALLLVAGAAQAATPPGRASPRFPVQLPLADRHSVSRTLLNTCQPDCGIHSKYFLQDEGDLSAEHFQNARQCPSVTLLLLLPWLLLLLLPVCPACTTDAAPQMILALRRSADMEVSMMWTGQHCTSLKLPSNMPWAASSPQHFLPKRHPSAAGVASLTVHSATD